MRAMFSILCLASLAVALQRGEAGLWHDALPMAGIAWICMVCALASRADEEGRP